MKDLFENFPLENDCKMPRIIMHNSAKMIAAKSKILLMVTMTWNGKVDIDLIPPSYSCAI